MKDRLTQLLELFKQANPATRMTLVLSTLAILGVAGISGWYANRPDLIEVFRNLSATEANDYKSALAEAGIDFRASPPPGPYSIWVDSADLYAASAAAALSGYRPEPKGIVLSTGGAGDAFRDAGTRLQERDKREWQDCEKQLEGLDFVLGATVGASGSNRTPFHQGDPQTISVMLDLRRGTSLTSAQKKHLAAMVRNRFNVPIENITIMDRFGELLHDGLTLASGGGTGDDLLEQKRHYDDNAERKANLLLEQALGAGMARVTVNSEWTFEEKESIQENVMPENRAVVQERLEEKNSTIPERIVGGAASVSANISPDFGNTSAGVGDTGTMTGGASSETTNEMKTSVVGTETTHTKKSLPQIKRLSVAMIVDASAAERLTELGEVVKGAVGFDEDRGDVFSPFASELASLERDEEGNPILPVKPEPVEPPNEYLEMFLEHGIELLAALAFIFVLARSLRGAGGSRKQRKARTQAAIAVETEQETRAAEAAAAAEALDPELLARVQVEELVRSDPERVSEILSQWAKEESPYAGVEK